MPDPLLYPQRQRCRTCRRFFGFIVHVRAFCSVECAEKGADLISPIDLPRCCRVRKTKGKGGWKAKLTFYGEEQAEEAAQREGSFWYRCEGDGGCGHFHLSKFQRSQK